MNRRKACLLIAASPAATGFAAESSDREERPWIGPEFWSNPLQDWRLRNGRIECFVSGGDRNAFLLTHDVTDQAGALSMRVRRRAERLNCRGRKTVHRQARSGRASRSRAIPES
jgi:hypothetical protein